MLVIRMQRTGRKGHAQFRVVVQDSRRTPTSGNVVAALGSYNPHTKTTTVDKEKAILYMSNGAQPSERVARLLVSEGVKLPDWVKKSDKKAGKIRNTDKLRRNRPAEEVPAPEEATEAEVPAEETVEAATEPQTTPIEGDAPAEVAAESPAEPDVETEVEDEPTADKAA